MGGGLAKTAFTLNRIKKRLSLKGFAILPSKGERLNLNILVRERVRRVESTGCPLFGPGENSAELGSISDLGKWRRNAGRCRNNTKFVVQ